MSENEKLELDLEEIMNEFSSDADETPDEEIKEWTAKVFGSDSEETEETVPAGTDDPSIPVEPVEDADPEELQQPVTGDTICLDTKAVREHISGTTADTIRLDTKAVQEHISGTTADTIRLDTIAVRDRISSTTTDTIRLDTTEVVKAQVRNAVRIVDEDGKTEAFSEQWEPEYEQPMGEYRPTQQIISHPRSRLHELKKKLVAGPEKRYYDLCEIGVGKLQAAIFFSLLVVLISAAATAFYAMDMIRPERMKLMIFGQLFVMAVSALLGSNQLIEGVGDLFRKRFSLNTLLVLTFAACVADGIFCLQQLRVPCCAAFSLEMTMSLWSAYQRRTAEMGQMDTMRKAIHLDSVVVQPDYHNGKKGFLRAQGGVEDFMDNYHVLSAPEKRMDIYAIVAAILSLAVGVTAGVLNGLSGDVMRGVSSGLQVFAVTLIAAVPVVSFVAVSRPFAVLEKRLHAIGTVLCGWQGVEQMSGNAVFPVSFEDLFPAGSCRMNGVKFFGSREPDQIVSYCTAVMEAENGGLAPLFTQVLDSRNAMHYDATELTRYENGIGGIVEGEQVLVGSLSFLKSMNVETPEGVRVSQAICVAIEGEFCGLFALSIDRFKSAVTGLDTLCSQRKLNPVLTAADFILTGGFIRNKMKVNTKRLEIPDQEIRQALAEAEPAEDLKAAALITTEGLAPFAYAVTGARMLRSSTKTGTIICMIGGGLGIAMMLALTLMGALQYLTPVNMFLYQLVWLLPGLLITEWTRNI